ncbi:acyl carrier protein synthase (ACP-CoA phosphopantetheinyltransferase)(Holo-ACP synthase) (holo-[acyl-carrier-protein] synthase (CoA:apo-[acyl-carrier-protein] pantetheinephosphotransferase)) [Candidatus Methylomirabilis oxygeniifera]|uniref:Holo-[acyl-carrier-protein] synthase n=1 Tax=Methylomirabilis oxygeniifera TaxID=671143 RepID=D5MFT6_METO1|nr:acyl carrier protein synthase (ACP-CoA phosphopantetheinyltransferase)(Holo-ACP synthase) (holo-[acyl-carrier-protein] synthase (CoA:apo-[acyl-carrier-protein] pantetheinephosphotransferase)) [Candidatus Methylomirabilis oxyfera]
MVIGIGIDLVQISRFEQAATRHGARLLNRLFTGAEQARLRHYRSPGRHLAARFAAKEAAFKALRTGWGQGVVWQDVEIVGGGREPSSVVLSGRARDVAACLGITQMLVTLTHDGDYAMACVVATDGR